MPTQNKRRDSALLLSFAELGNKHYSQEDRERLTAAAEKAAAALVALTQQVVGYAVSQLQHLTLPTRMAEDALFVDFTASDFPGSTDDFVAALGESLSHRTLTTGAMAPESVVIDTASSQKELMDWGSELVTGLLHGFKDELNSIIGAGMKEGLGREEIMAKLLAESSPEAGALMPDWRARLIAQTEVIRAYNGDRFAQLVGIGAHYVQWMDGQKGACNDCRAMDGAVLPMEGTGRHDQGLFVSTFRGFVVQYPPLHPGCRCAIASADHEDYAAQPNFADVKYIPDGELTGPPVHLPPATLVAARFRAKPSTILHPPVPALDPVTVRALDRIAKGDSISGVISDAAGGFGYGSPEYATVWKKVTDALGLPETATRSEVKAAATKSPPKAPAPAPKVPEIIIHTKPVAPVIVEPIAAMAHSKPADMVSAEGVKWWLDNIAPAGTLGIDVMRGYAKFLGKPMTDISTAMKKAGYEVRMLTDAPKGTMPAPSAKIASKASAPPKTKPATVATVDGPTPSSLGFKSPTSAALHAEVDDAYWNGLTKTGEAAGSNKGGFYVGPDGKQYYIKEYTDTYQGIVEARANSIYRALGIEAPVSGLRTVGGKTVYVSEILTGAPAMGGNNIAKWLKENPEYAAKLHVASSILENWDVFGASFDNVVFKNGKLVPIDSGGSFEYRARGGMKSGGYTGSIKTFDTLLDTSINPTAGKAFKDLYDDVAAIRAGAETAKWIYSIADEIPNMSAADRAIMKNKAKATEVVLNGMLYSKLNPPKPFAPTGPAGSDYLSKKGIKLSKATEAAIEKDQGYNALATLKAHAKQASMDIETYKAAVEARLREVLADAKLSMRIDPEILEHYVLPGDGRFKSQFETKSSNGWLNTSARAKAEKSMFDYPQSMADVTRRPIYGYLSPKGGEVYGPSGYGAVKLVMKDEVRDRATFVYGDSLGIHPSAAPSPVSDPKWYSTTLISPGRVPLHEAKLDDAPAYPEVQYHGGLSVADVEYALLPSSNPVLESLLTQRGIPYYVDRSLTTR